MPTKEELQKIIEQFNENELKQQGVFSILQYGGGSDESFIRANKEGLELFALELLKSARDSENVLTNPDNNSILLDPEAEWVDQDSNTFLQYIELIADKQNLYPITNNKPSIMGILLPFGCGIIIIILLISTVVGIITVFNWIF